MIELIMTILVLGLVVWAISFLPIPEPFMTIIRVLVIIVAVILLLNFLGVTGIPLRLR